MKSKTSTALFMFLYFVLTPRSYAVPGAEAWAGGRIADGVDPSDHHTAAVATTANKHNGDVTTYYSANSSVNGPILKAAAFAQLSNEAQFISVSGIASAYWEDELTLDNPLLLIDLTQGILFTTAYFVPHFDGEGDHGSMQFGASTYIESRPEVAPVSKGFEAAFGPESSNLEGSDGLVDDKVILRFPARWFVDTVTYRMTLSVRSDATTPGEYSEVKFHDTATLSTIVIADENGMPIPALAGANFSITGSSGLTYALTTTTPAPLGDYNENGVVDSADYVVWQKSLGQTADLSADGNGDELIDIKDYNIWRLHFGQIINFSATPNNSLAVPEPASAALLLSGMLMILYPAQRRN